MYFSVHHHAELPARGQPCPGSARRPARWAPTYHRSAALSRRARSRRRFHATSCSVKSRAQRMLPWSKKLTMDGSVSQASDDDQPLNL